MSIMSHGCMKVGSVGGRMNSSVILISGMGGCIKEGEDDGVMGNVVSCELLLTRLDSTFCVVVFCLSVRHEVRIWSKKRP